MSCVDSLTYTGSLMADLNDMDTDQIKLFEHFKFKDPSDISNSLDITKHKDKVIYFCVYNCIILF